MGLEIEASITFLNDFREYWKIIFTSNKEFENSMGRCQFLGIRRCLNINPIYDESLAVRNPRGHSRLVLEKFGKNRATLAVTTGVSNLDENSIRCNGRKTARMYVKSKPVRFGSTFYTIAVWKDKFSQTMSDNESGLKIGSCLYWSISYTLLPLKNRARTENGPQFNQQGNFMSSMVYGNRSSNFSLSQDEGRKFELWKIIILAI